MAVISPADDEALQRGPDDRSNGHDVRGDFCGPVTFLVPGQQVAGEREGQHEQQEAEAEPEVDFARGFVGPVDDHLHQVQDEQDVHHRGSEVVNAAQQPAASHLVLDVINAFPCRLRTRAVGHPEKKPGDELDGEAKDQRAAPDVTPARAARDVFVKRILDDAPITSAAIEPVEQPVHHAGIFSLSPARKF